jgi:hypothetical protein
LDVYAVFLDGLHILKNPRGTIPPRGEKLKTRTVFLLAFFAVPAVALGQFQFHDLERGNKVSSGALTPFSFDSD